MLIRHYKRIWRSLLGAAMTLLLLGLLYRPVVAHSRAVVGDYVILLGWQSEPPLVGERNELFIEVERESTGAPVSGLEATLSSTIVYGEQTFRVNLVPSAQEPGLYTAALIPTVRGTYSFQLTGMIEETAVDLVLDADEVFPAARLQFPETAPDTLTLQNDLQAQIDVLTANLRTARLLAIAGPIIGLLSLLVGALGLRKASSSGD